jgi:E3 ubiquitin-protein ligase TRIP12
MVNQWILDQAVLFKKTYFPTQAITTTSDTSSSKTDKKAETSSTGLDVLEKLKKSVFNLDSNSFKSLKKINSILHATDISSFEMIHSGLIEKLLTFLSLQDSSAVSTFAQPLNSTTKIKGSYILDFNRLLNNEHKVLKIKQFLNVFLNLPLMNYESEQKKTDSTPTSTTHFSLLLSKLHNCINQQEQYAVRVHDVPSSIGYGKTAIKFFNTHQLKCLLQRHPSLDSPKTVTSATSSSNLRQWKGGNVKVDPLAVVGTIEKYLIMRGIHKPPTLALPANKSINLTSSKPFSLPSSSYHNFLLQKSKHTTSHTAPTSSTSSKVKSPSGLFIF